MAGSVQATDSFFDASTGVEFFVREGEVLDGDDPIVARHADLFKEVVARPVTPTKPTRKTASGAADK